MRNLAIISLISIVIFSCDGRKSKKEALKLSVSEFNQTELNQDFTKVYPNEYMEVVTDTLIANGSQVRIKNYSNSDEMVFTKPHQKLNSKTDAFHRVFESEIVVMTKTKTIYRVHISAKNFELKNQESFWNNATLQHSWVNQESSNRDLTNIDVSFFDPLTDAYKLYRVSIKSNGTHQIELIEETT